MFWGHFTQLVVQQRFEGSAFVTCVASWSNALINLKLQHPPASPSYATHGHLTVFSCQLSVPVDGKFEQCLAGVGNLTQKGQIFLTEYK